jgi:hypothetical protein
VLFCVMCVILCVASYCIPLPPGTNTFAVKINNNKNNKIDIYSALWVPDDTLHLPMCIRIYNARHRMTRFRTSILSPML